MERDGRQYRLIDTAGLRRRARIEDAVENFSRHQDPAGPRACHVAVLILDATEGVTDQDATLVGAILDGGRALVVPSINGTAGTYEARQQTESWFRRN